MENCSKFWLQPENEARFVRQYHLELNNSHVNEIYFPCSDYLTLTRASIIVALDHSDGKMYRARLIGWDYNPRTRIFKGTVRFLDSGRSQKVQMCDLFLFKADIEQSQMPPRCFECRLAEIQPSTANISGGHAWDRRVIERFQQTVLNRRVKAEVIFNLTFLSVIFLQREFFHIEFQFQSNQFQFVSFIGLFSGEWRCKCYHSYRWYKSE